MTAPAPADRVVRRGRDFQERAAIDVRGLWKRYGDADAVRGITFDVQKGEIFGLIGPDGAGKTSTLQILSGVMEATVGRGGDFRRSGASHAVADGIPDASL